MTRMKVVKRSSNRDAPRGPHKRRRALDDEMSRADVWSSSEDEDAVDASDDMEVPRPSTPKRSRIAPADLPLGLERGDFHALHLQNLERQSNRHDEPLPEEDEDDEWTSEDDQMLVELVLEKLQLSKSEWQDCARSLGKDRHSVGKRWKSLISAGDVGIKRQGRSRLHGTWR